MSRNDLLLRCGEPLRVEAATGGGESWYYRFTWWETHPTGVAETHEEFGDKTSSVSVGLNVSKSNEEQAIHLSSDGYVTEPLPRGKVVKNTRRE